VNGSQRWYFARFCCMPLLVLFCGLSFHCAQSCISMCVSVVVGNPGDGCTCGYLLVERNTLLHTQYTPYTLYLRYIYVRATSVGYFSWSHAGTPGQLFSDYRTCPISVQQVKSLRSSEVATVRVLEATISQIHDAFYAGAFNCTDIVTAYVQVPSLLAACAASMRMYTMLCDLPVCVDVFVVCCSSESRD
jgi:hypothetical protein